MPHVSSSDYHRTSAETNSTYAEEHELEEIQEQNTQSSVSPYPELPKDWTSGLRFKDRLEERKNDFTEEERGNAWTEVDKAVKTYSDEMIQRWNEEMDNLLVYAGLFSAVLTAFNVESYSLLSPTAPDPVIAAITQISAQLASFSVNDPFVNSTQPAFRSSLASSDSTSPQRWVVWLNALWFSSLICSLSAASIAIMVKQWIHEYKSGISGASRHTAHLRQHRYNGLVRWKVAAIIAVLPILLQIALGLFLAGLLVLLWNLNRTVAIVASTLVGALLAFTLVTIVLPAFTSNCAYLSPLSTSVFRLFRLVLMHIPWSSVSERLLSVYLHAPSGSLRRRISSWLWRICPRSLSPSVYAMQSAHVTEHPLRLDQDVFITAYSTTGDLSLLEHASACFSKHSIGDLSEFLTRIHTQNKEYGQPAGDIDHWTKHIPVDMANDMLLVRAYNALHAAAVTSGQHTSSWQEMMDEYVSDASHIISSDHRNSYVISNLAAVLYNNGEPHYGSHSMFKGLSKLYRQMSSVKNPHSALTIPARRCVIAAIHTVLRTRHASLLLMDTDDVLRECGLCLHILISCSPTRASRSQPGDMAEEDTRWKPLADAIAMAEDVAIRTLQCPKFLHQEDRGRCYDIDTFFVYYQDISLEQLATRVSKKMLRALEGAVQDLVDSELYDYQQLWKPRWLEWLELLRKERDRQRSMRARQNEEEPDGDKEEDAHEHEHETGHEHEHEHQDETEARDEIEGEDKTEHEENL